MDIIKGILILVGLVVMVAAVLMGTIKLLARFGTQITAGCKSADLLISSSIKKVL